MELMIVGVCKSRPDPLESGREINLGQVRALYSLGNLGNFGKDSR